MEFFDFFGNFARLSYQAKYFIYKIYRFNIIIYSILLNWQSLTRGPLGIPAITRPEIFGFTLSDNLPFLGLVLVITGIIYAIAQAIGHSSFGRVLKAIREDEKAIEVFGYNIQYYKLTIFVISAMMASIAGALFASYISFIDPSTFTLNESIFILVIIILGGLANNKGTIWGAVFLILFPELLRFVGFPDVIAAQMRQVAYGLILIFLMLYRPQGLMGEYKL